MLVIGAQQEEALDLAVSERFAAELEQYLSEREPEVLPCLAPPARPLVVSGMIARAHRLGVAQRSSIALFCDLMQGVAPNFYRHPAVARLYGENGADPNEVTQSLGDLIPAETWEEIAARRSDLPLYTPAEADESPLTERTAAALPLLFWGEAAAGASMKSAEAGMSEAKRLKLTDAEDAGLVLAALMRLYASPESVPDWAEQAASGAGSSHAKLELMRFRVAVDFGRRI